MLDSQRLALLAAGVDASRIASETVSGAVPAAARPDLAGLLSVLRPGDALSGVCLDRLGRSQADAGWERAILRQRTREGLAAARARGEALGRRRTLTLHQRRHVAELAEAGHSVREFGQRLGCSALVAYRAIAEAKATDVVVAAAA